MTIYRLLLFRWAPLIYFVTALPAAILVAFLAPPFQRPDEASQFLHAVQGLGEGIPSDAATFSEAFRSLVGHPEAKVDASLVASARSLSWMGGRAQVPEEPKTLVKPAIFALPVMAGLALGRLIGLELYDSYTMGRIFNAVVAVSLGTLAIGMALHGRALLFCLLGLPTALYLAGTAAPEATLTAAVALAVGLCSRAGGRNQPISPWWRLLMAVLTGFAVASQLSYLPLLVLLLTSAVQPGRPRSSFDSLLVALGPFCLAVAIVLGWIVLMGRATSLPLGTLTSAALHAKIDGLRQQWLAIIGMPPETLMRAGVEQAQAFIGNFGWSDTPIPVAFYRAWTLGLIVAAALAFVEEGDTPSFGTGLVMLFCGALAACAVFLFTTPDPVEPQGRLLLPVAMLLALAVPGMIVPLRHRTYSAFGDVCAVLGWVAIFGLSAVSGWLMLPPVLLNRFFL